MRSTDNNSETTQIVRNGSLRVDKSISVGNVLVFVGLVGNFVAFVGGFNRSLATLEANANEHRRRIEQLEATTRQLADTQSLMRENLVVLTEIVKTLKQDIADLKRKAGT